MPLFKDMLSSNETIFKNELALDFNFLPKLIPYRESEQHQIAYCIKPLFQKKNGKNIFIYGKPGIGKTAAVRNVLRELEEESEEVIPIYINCWEKNTSFKILYHICELLGYKFIQNKKTEELSALIKSNLNKKSAVFAFDEVDKLENSDFIYVILEEIYRKSIILITNEKKWLSELDDRILSRLTPDILEFRPYNPKETEGILRQRIEYAFVPNVIDEEAFKIILSATINLQDIRQGLYLLKESAQIAESKSSRKVTVEHARAAIEKIENFTIKDKDCLEENDKHILGILEKNSGKKIGDIYNTYQELGGDLSYKSFQRKVNKLGQAGFVSLKKTEGGKEGNTTIIEFKNQSTKKLTDF